MKRSVAILCFATMCALLMGSGSPLAARAGGPIGTTAITDISVTCGDDNNACGVVTVENPVGGATITLTLTVHQPGDAEFTDTGITTTITLVDGVTEYDYCIAVPAEYANKAVYNTRRIEVASTSGATFTGTTTKSASFDCEGGTQETPTVTETVIVETETPVTETATVTETVAVETETPVTETATVTVTETTGGETETPDVTETVVVETETPGEETETPGTETATVTGTETTGIETETPASGTATVVVTPATSVPVTDFPNTGAGGRGPVGGTGVWMLVTTLGLFGLGSAAYGLRRRYGQLG